MDLLPHAVSGVYFIYHRDFEKWSFGKLSALREAALAAEGGYGYYYMGYYIHGCKKMRYKGDYKPQYVLDYHSWEWDVLDEEMRRLMDRRKYASMSKERQRRATRVQQRRVLGEAEGGDAQLQALATATDPSDNLTKASADAHAAGDYDNPDEEEEEEDEDEQTLYPTPLEATRSSLSLLYLGMPGVLSLAQLHADIRLDEMKVYLGGGGGRGGLHEMRDLVAWHTGSEMETGSIKGTIAEFAAAVGPVVARDVVADFSR